MKRLRMLVALLAVLAGLVVLVPVAFGAHSPRPRNVLLVTVDSLRADRLGCYGNTRGLTPNMDLLARQGVRFERAIAQASCTWPSLHSLITSTYVGTHGAWSWQFDSRISLATLPEVLAKQGYSCGMVNGHEGLAGSWSLTRGMDPVQQVKAHETVPAVTRMLQRFRKAPFFVWVHLMEAHSSRIPLQGDREHVFAAYDQAVTRADQEFGAVMSALEDLDLYENTTVILTADHGEVLSRSADGFVGHGRELFEDLIHVPLILAHGRDVPEGVAVSGLVEHVDVVPSLCEILGVNPSPTFEGRSFMPLVTGVGAGRRLTFSENVESPPGDQAHLPRDAWIYVKSCVRTGEWKLVETRYPGGRRDVELFRLAVDPREETNLAEREEDRAAHLGRILDEWRARPQAAPAGPTRSLDEKRKQELKSLHYML